MRFDTPRIRSGERCARTCGCLSLLVLISACTERTPRPAASVEAFEVVVAPDALTLQAGGQGQLAAQVNDRMGNPIGGAEIRYSVSDTRLLNVNRNGLVTAAGPAPSDAVVVVSSGERRRNVSVHVAPGPARNIVVESGDGQMVDAGGSPGMPLAVQVVDAFGNPIPDAAAVFEPEAEAFPAHEGLSDGDGRITFEVPRLTTAGPLRIPVRIEGREEPSATFALVVAPGPPAVLKRVEADGAGEAGAGLAVQVEDAYGNPVPDVVLDVRAGQVALPDHPRTDARGVATITLPQRSQARRSRIEVRVAQQPSVRVVFSGPA